MPQKLVSNQSDSVISPLIDVMMNGLAVFLVIFVLSEKVMVNKLEFIDNTINPITSGQGYYQFTYSVKNLRDNAVFKLIEGKEQFESVGLEFDEKSGRIFGNVKGIETKTEIPIKIVVAAGEKKDTTEDVLKIYPLCYPSANDPLEIVELGTKLPPGRVGQAYQQRISAAGGSGRYNWEATGLPKGLVVDQKAGIILGEPIEKGKFELLIKLKNSEKPYVGANLGSDSTTRVFSLKILPEQITGKLTLPLGRLGEDYQGVLEVGELLAHEEAIWEAPEQNTLFKDSLDFRAYSGLYPTGLGIGGVPLRTGAFQVSVHIVNTLNEGDVLLSQRGTINILGSAPSSRIGGITYQVNKGELFRYKIPYQGLTEPVVFKRLESPLSDNDFDNTGRSFLSIDKNEVYGDIREAGTYELMLEATPAIGNSIRGEIKIVVVEGRLPLQMILPDKFVALPNKRFQFTPGIKGGSGSYLWQVENLADASFVQLNYDEEQGLITGWINKTIPTFKIRITVADEKDADLKSVSKILYIDVIDSQDQGNPLVRIGLWGAILLLLILIGWGVKRWLTKGNQTT